MFNDFRNRTEKDVGSRQTEDFQLQTCRTLYHLSYKYTVRELKSDNNWRLHIKLKKVDKSAKKALFEKCLKFGCEEIDLLYRMTIMSICGRWEYISNLFTFIAFKSVFSLMAVNSTSVCDRNILKPVDVTSEALQAIRKCPPAGHIQPTQNHKTGAHKFHCLVVHNWW